MEGSDSIRPLLNCAALTHGLNLRQLPVSAICVFQQMDGSWTPYHPTGGCQENPTGTCQVFEKNVFNQ